MSANPHEQPRCLDDGAYLLGALPLEERAAYEEHLRGCATCRGSLPQLAGLPGLLRKVPGEVVEVLDRGEHDTEVPPETLLAGVLERVEAERCTRRRRVVLRVGAAAAAVAAVAAVVVGLRDDGAGDVPPPPAEVVAFEEVRETPLTVTARLTGVAWGTRIELLCSYADGAGDLYRSPPEYALVIRSTSGDVEQVASWRAVPGRQVTIEAATALRPGRIAVLEVRTPSGQPVLVSRG